jgi:tetratricopeptide (TPR) repeat protein
MWRRNAYVSYRSPSGKHSGYPSGHASAPHIFSLRPGTVPLMADRPAKPATHAAPPAQPFPEALFRQAMTLHQAGALPAAEAAYRAVLEASPRHATTMTLLATIVAQNGQPEEAVRLFDASLKLDRNQELALFNRGNALFGLKRHAEALASYNRAVALWPGHAPLLNNRGNALLALGRKLEALAAFDRAIAADPDYADAHFNRGNVLHALGREAEALASLDRAVALAPDHVGAAFNRAIVLQALGRYDAALDGYDRTIALAPGPADAWHARSWPLELFGRRDEALASVEQAIALVPNHALAWRAKALLLLRRGDYAEGWRLAEWRWDCPDAPPRRQFVQKLWLGDEDIFGKTVLLHAEQGYGDSFQYCRYAPLVAERGARVILEVPRPLVPAMARLEGVAQLVAEGDRLPPFDLHCPLMSLPLAFRTELNSVPRQVPYLRAKPDSLERWAARLGPARQPRVGPGVGGKPGKPA